MRPPAVCCGVLLAIATRAHALPVVLAEAGPDSTIVAPADSTTLAPADSQAAADSAIVADSTSSGALVAPPPVHPSLATRGRRTLSAFGSDAWAVVSSPARMDARTAAWTAVAVGLGVVVYANDEAILAGFERSRGNALYDPIIDVGDAIEPAGFMPNANLAHLGLLAIGHAFHVRALETVPAEMIESHLIAGGLRNVAKVVVGRTHPFDGEGARAFGRRNGSSFPSGHTSVVFEIATVVSHHARSLPVSIALYGLASALALQRIDSRNHWPSDVYVAALSGTAIAHTVVTRNRARAGGLALAPRFEPGEGLVGIQLRTSF